MKALDDLRATVRTDNDGCTTITTKTEGKSRTVIYTKDEAMQLIGALALSIRHPLMRFDVDWAGRDEDEDEAPPPRVSAREAETKMIPEPDPIRCASCGSFTHAHMRRCVACNKLLHPMPADIMAREPSPYLRPKKT